MWRFSWRSDIPMLFFNLAEFSLSLMAAVVAVLHSASSRSVTPLSCADFFLLRLRTHSPLQYHVFSAFHFRETSKFIFAKFLF